MIRFVQIAACIAAVTLLAPAASLAQAVSPAPSAAPSAAPAPLAAAVLDPAVIGAAVRKAMNAAGVPGVAVEVVDHGRTIVHAGYGVQNVAKNDPVDPETRFEIGSVTKQFTAAAILQLKERGKLKLSDRLGTYVPEYGAAKDVTIQQMLWQVSGLPNYTEISGFATIAKTKPGSLAAIVALIEKKPLNFTPGTKWEYSNTNYVMLGRVVEVASRMPWDAYVRKNIFAVAGMARSTFMEEEARTSDFATGYSRDKEKKLVAEPSFGHWATSAGAIVSTVGDMAKWDQALFEGKIVSQDDLALMTASGTLSNGKPTDYGFGWIVDTHSGQKRVWHNGGTFGFAAANHIYPALGERIIVLENTSFAPADAIADKIFAAMHPDLAAAEMQAVPGEEPAITARAREWLRRVQTGDIDRTQLGPQFAAALTPQLVERVKGNLLPLGEPASFVFRGKRSVGTATAYDYRVVFATETLVEHIVIDEAGKITGLLFGPG